MIAPNVIVIWPSTNASIPSGFTRETTLDSKFTRGTAASTDPNTTGGATTHTHTSSAHSHTMSSHTHLIFLHQAGGNDNNSDSDGSESFSIDHYHSVNIAGVTNGGLSSVTSTYASVSNNPPYYEVIFIKASGYSFIPNGAVIMESDTTIQTGFANCDGTGGTPDLRNKYLLGAGTGADSGTTGGSLTNIHDLTHTHTETAHWHSQAVAGGASAAGGSRGQSGNTYVHQGHTHNAILNDATAGSIGSVSLTTAETVEPAYKKLLAIENTSGAALLPVKGMVAMWLGTLATIPAGWFLCDGTKGTPDMREKFIKCALTTGEIGNIGGSTTHTHASQGHTHTGGSHTHTPTTNDLTHPQGEDRTVGGVGGSRAINKGDNSHGQIDSVDNGTASWNSSNTTGDSSNNEPLYTTVAYIQFQYSVGGAALFALA